jgi:rhodanese-related sulfurtransferase/DNA-binding transcriptional ArsR family regulator
MPGETKAALYEQFARIGAALAAPKRLELVDLLSQGEKTVETLARDSATPVKNTSAHLRILRGARLVDTRRDGTFVYYRLATDGVFRLVRDLQALGQERLAEVEQAARDYLGARDEMEPVSLTELRRRLSKGDVTLIDVRPEAEYRAGHIPGALSMPVDQLGRRYREIPKRREVIAYCRGPYCVYSADAVKLLRKRGYRARRMEEGLPDWRSAGHTVSLALNS